MTRPNRMADGTIYLWRPFNKTHCSVVKESWIFFKKIVLLIEDNLKQKGYLIISILNHLLKPAKWFVHQAPVTKPFV